jgi:hypothetical protein
MIAEEAKKIRDLYDVLTGMLRVVSDSDEDVVTVPRMLLIMLLESKLDEIDDMLDFITQEMDAGRLKWPSKE